MAKFVLYVLFPVPFVSRTFCLCRTIALLEINVTDMK